MDEQQTVTVTAIRQVTERYDKDQRKQVKLDKPFYAIECDGLPQDGKGQLISSFSLWEDSPAKPGDFGIGKSYKVEGYVQGKWFNFKKLVGEVENATPGVNGVPRDSTQGMIEGAVGHDAAVLAAGLYPTLSNPKGVSTMIEVYETIREALLSYRLGDNHQAEAKEGPTANSGGTSSDSMDINSFQGLFDETTPPGEEYPPA